MLGLENIEDEIHLLNVCDLYAKHRAKLATEIPKILDQASNLNHNITTTLSSLKSNRNTASPHNLNYNYDISHYLNLNTLSTSDDVTVSTQTLQSDTPAPLSDKIKSQIITKIAHFINKCLETRRSHTYCQ